MCVSGTDAPACSVTIVNVGLTIRSGGIPSASPTPLQKSVFPAPRSPVSPTTSPGRSAAPSSRAIARVSSGEPDVNETCLFSNIGRFPPVLPGSALRMVLFFRRGFAEDLLQGPPDVADHVGRRHRGHRVVAHQQVGRHAVNEDACAGRVVRREPLGGEAPHHPRQPLPPSPPTP